MKVLRVKKKKKRKKKVGRVASCLGTAVCHAA